MRRNFQNFSGIVIPRNSRGVFTPFEGLNIRVVTDLFVTAAITEDYPVVGVTTYGDLTPANETDDAFNSYVLVNMQEQPQTWFTKMTFVKTFSATAPFRTVTDRFGNHSWPPILKSLNIIQDSAFPQVTQNVVNGVLSQVISPNYYIREAYIPEMLEGSRFKLEEFWSASPFVIPRYPVPTPTSVSYDINGVRGSFPRCLHPEIDLPATATATLQRTEGTTVGINQSLEGQFFPATNMQGWSSYILSDSQSQLHGAWYRKRVRVYPPSEPAVNIQ